MPRLRNEKRQANYALFDALAKAYLEQPSLTKDEQIWLNQHGYKIPANLQKAKNIKPSDFSQRMQKAYAKYKGLTQAQQKAEQKRLALEALKELERGTITSKEKYWLQKQYKKHPDWFDYDITLLTRKHNNRAKHNGPRVNTIQARIEKLGIIPTSKASNEDLDAALDLLK